ncbi:sister chromatid cohesion protein DCC1-like [Ruditapes philippinarum]|uniref:sister chromatid cohesion protein DCC1-like n=1 Tax=Ruditapes philippinarum TaxID=129788 RepID=UPI00295B7791|nr:sister chromatid cohesion protein DCC1-like [Ruditapes philippinarum]
MDCYEQEKRNLKEIDAVLDFAKLPREEIKPKTQSIYFSKQLDNEGVKLIELDKTVLQAFENGEKVVIRGDKEDSAVLCTNTQTYDIKEGEVSNAMLLLTDLNYGNSLESTGDAQVEYREVNTVIHTFFELRPCKPRLAKLRTMLNENPYSGQASEEDEDHQGKKYTFNEILDLVQGSETEIMKALDKMQALVINGYWRVLDFDFLVQVMTHLLQLCDENDWTHTGIPIEECVSVLQELFPRNVIEHVLKNFSTKLSSNTTEDDDEEKMQIDIDYYRLDEDKVCRFFAEQILKHARKFNLNQFLSTWEKSVPEGMKTTLFQLEGMALIDRQSTPEVICYLSADTLPEDINERFDFLFRTKEKWTLEEITPYIKDLETDKMNISAMLTKFARASTTNGVKMYNSRKPLT